MTGSYFPSGNDIKIIGIGSFVYIEKPLEYFCLGLCVRKYVRNMGGGLFVPFVYALTALVVSYNKASTILQRGMELLAKAALS